MADSSAGTLALEGPLVRIGCAGLPPGVARDAYFRRLDLLEVDATFFDPPREATLRRWRKEAPAAAAFSVPAWQLVTHEADTAGYERLATPLPPEARGRVGSFRDTEEVRAAWRRTLEAAVALRAETVVFHTPPSFSTTDAHRDAMRRFLGEVVGDPGELTLVWEPRGIWEPEQAARFAEELGLIYACDPLQLEVPPPPAERAYFRIHGLGLYRNKIDDDQLDLLAGFLEDTARAWVVFANTERYPDAQRFRRLWEGREDGAEED